MTGSIVLGAVLAAVSVLTSSWLTDITFARGGWHFVAMFLLAWAFFVWVQLALAR